MFILSSQYGLIPSEKEIAAYDMIMTEERARELAPQVAQIISGFDWAIYYRTGARETYVNCIRQAARLINNKLMELGDKAGISPLPYPLQGLLIADIQEGLRKVGVTDYLSGYAGQICGMITELKSAKQVVDEIVEGALKILKETLPTEVITGSMAE